MNEESKYIPNNEKIVRLKALDTFVGDLAAGQEITRWGLMMLVAEVGAAYYALQDKLMEKGILSEDNIAEMQVSMTNPQYMQGLYMHLAKVFHEKCERIEFAATHPEEVTEFVERRNAGENPEDPMIDKGEDE
jgi:hypothetical protein